MLVFFTFGCSGAFHKISSKEIKQCQEACKDFGGLLHVRVGFGLSYDYNSGDEIMCVNGNVITGFYRGN